MLLCVEHIVLNAAFLQHITDFFGIFNRNRTYEHRLSGCMRFRNSVRDCMELRRLLRENRIVEVFSDYRLIRRNHNYVHVVDFTEFVLFCLCGTCHTRKLVVHSEIVLKRDGRKGL